MNILIIGSGGREHALTKYIAESESAEKVFCAPGNPGIFEIAKPIELDSDCSDSIIEACRKNAVDLVVIGPEKPLAEGLADALLDAGISAFGPCKEAARLESSKDFAKRFMKKYGIPTAEYQTFTLKNRKEARLHIDANDPPYVMKADGLAAGKGVLIASNAPQARAFIDHMFDGKFGLAGKKIVFEEFLEGEEASALAICDGRDYIMLASSQDHKRALDGDDGPNTGGMGAYAPAPIIDAKLAKKIENEIIAPALKGMEEEGSPFIGCLYAGLMIKDGAAKVVEFNVRFGDPETQAVLSVFDGDLAGLLASAAKGRIDRNCVKSVAKGSACCVVAASQGYPGACEKGFEIKGIKDAEAGAAYVFHAGTKLENGKLVSSGGRVLGVTGLGENLSDAVAAAYEAAEKISFNNMFYRSDIGAKGLRQRGISQ